MKSVPLLILSLVTGCEALFKMDGCIDGWVSFTCKYPENKTYERIVIAKPQKPNIVIEQENKWQKRQRYNMYHDTNKKNVEVVIKSLKSEDEGKYRCVFSDTTSDRVELVLSVKDCGKAPFTQVAYRRAKTTISCNNGQFLCKENDNFCQRLPTTPEDPTWVFTPTNRDNSGFDVSIRNITKENGGRYWCEMESQNGLKSRTGLKLINLKVEGITEFSRTVTIGEEFTYWCSYRERDAGVKFICKGEDPSKCKQLASTVSQSVKYHLDDNILKRNITITMRNVAAEDSGTYWCGAKSDDSTKRDLFFLRFLMKAVQSETVFPTGPPETESASASAEPVFSTEMSDVTAESREGPPMVIIGVSVVCLLLPFGLILVIVYKCVSKSRTPKSEGQKSKDERLYEEVHELSQQPDSGAIYSTASAPSDVPPNLLHYATVDFKVHPDRGNREVMVPNPSYSTCEYSTLRTSRPTQSS